MNVIESYNKVRENVTGFKSACVSFCYGAFFVIVASVTVIMFILIIIGGINKEFAVSLQVLKDTFIPVITNSMAFFGIAVGACFGASALQPKKEEPTEQTN